MRWLFSIHGRVGRLEWWMALLLGTAINVAGAFIIIGREGMDAVLNETLSSSSVALLLILSLIANWIALASSIKRYHDRDRSGWWILLVLIPFGVIFTIIECGFFPGTDGSNSYGDRHGTTSRSDLINSVRMGDNVRSDIRTQRQEQKTSRQPVKVNTPTGNGFGRRTSSPYS